MILYAGIAYEGSVCCRSPALSAWSPEIRRPRWWGSSSPAIIGTVIPVLWHSWAHKPWEIPSDFRLRHSVTGRSRDGLPLLYFLSHILQNNVDHKLWSPVINQHLLNEFSIIVLVSNLDTRIFLNNFKIIGIEIENSLDKLPKQGSKLIPRKPIDTLPNNISANLSTIRQVHRNGLNNKFIVGQTSVQIRMELV